MVILIIVYIKFILRIRANLKLYIKFNIRNIHVTFHFIVRCDKYNIIQNLIKIFIKLDTES